MKKFIFAIATLVISTAAASAADLAVKAPAPVPYVPMWTGFYIGGNIGAVRQEGRWDDFNQGALVSGTEGAGGCIEACGSNLASKIGFIGGLQAGYNWQSGSTVFGVEADGSWLNGRIHTDHSPQRGFLNTTSDLGVDWVSTVRGRMGLAVDRTLVYITGGVAFGGVNNSVASVCAGEALANQRCNAGDNVFLTNKETRVGWTVGGGVEHMFTPNWTVRAEALFVDLGQSGRIVTVNTQNREAFSGRFDNTLLIGRVGVNYKF